MRRLMALWYCVQAWWQRVRPHYAYLAAYTFLKGRESGVGSLVVATTARKLRLDTIRDWERLIREHKGFTTVVINTLTPIVYQRQAFEDATNAQDVHSGA